MELSFIFPISKMPIGGTVKCSWQPKIPTSFLAGHMITQHCCNSQHQTFSGRTAVHPEGLAVGGLPLRHALLQHWDHSVAGAVLVSQGAQDQNDSLA